ncbi:hypothetical protein HDU83_002233 [Entophlyctis luteolus]|nr:hypothetical protein HDU83_002233 [Entophlyctis luteolus]
MSALPQSFVDSVGPATRITVALAALLSLISMLARASLDEARGWSRPFEIVVGYLVSRSWTYFTAGFVETNPVLLPICLLGLLLSGRYFERVWGIRETLKFVALTNTLSVILCTITVFGEFVASQQNEDLLYKTYIGGMFGLLAAFLVAFKQAVPEHALSLMGIFSVRVKHLPSISVSAFFVLWLLRIVHVNSLMVFYGTVTAWVYIRFFKYHDGIRGDRSESFSFSSFFPASTHRVVIPISNSTFNLMVSLHLLPKLSPVLPQTSSGGAGFGGMRPFSPKPLPGSDAAEAERRRAIALRALDMRLNEVALAAAGGGSVPDSVPVAAGPALAAVIAANGSRTASGAATPSRGADAAAENASGGGNAP